MYETLNSIPLFQGMNGIDLNLVFDKVQWRIECLEDGDAFVQQGDLCRDLVFLLSGTVKAQTLSPDESYTFTEQVEGPAMLEGDILYGIQRHWGSTYTSVDVSRLMLIPKSDVIRMLASLEVFRINYLNAICTLASKRRRHAWREPAPMLRQRLVQFITSHTLQTKGPVWMSIRLSDLGEHLGATRSLVSPVLHKMQQEGILTMGRSNIYIPDLANLH